MAVERILMKSVAEIIKKTVPVISQEIGSVWGVQHELEKLQKTLEMIIAVIADAERKQVRDEAVRLWLRWLRDVVYDADDVIDEFSYETMHLGERDKLKYKVRDFVSCSNPIPFRSKLARKIEGINNKFDQITKDMHRFQLEAIPSDTTVHGESSERRSRQTTSFASQSQIVGREDDKDKLIRILTMVTTSSSTSLSSPLENVLDVVSIVGMGGLGKTTLAHHVYNDKSVKKHFEPIIWVCVSDGFDVSRLLSDIMKSITKKRFSDLSNFNELVYNVRFRLTGKRYLLVLDDLRNEDAEQWKRFQNLMNVGAHGSKILTTTRKRQVADVVKGSISPYFLETLQAYECWSIMERKAFSPGGALKTPNMINIGIEIATKCSGLPLAAKFLGSLMHSKNKESNWLSIRENDMWNTPESKIMPILKLSYDNLSPHLQRCFSYCSIFPKDWELRKQTLIQLWMAEGFLHPSNEGINNCSFEDLGDEYFESLMWSSFFDGVKKNELDDVTTFKMHDLVHDLAQAVVGDHECSTSKVTELKKLSEVRRLNLIMDKELSASFPNTINNINKLRTIIVTETRSLNLRRFSSNKHLRVLHLGDLADDLSEITYKTSKLKQLRYYHVTGLHLSSRYHSIGILYNLQTLVLSGCVLVPNLVKEMGSLKHLRHLDISSTDIKELPASVTGLHNLQSLDLNHCKNLIIFPDSVIGLECLRFLDMSFTPIFEIPNFVTSLLSLQTLDVNTCTYLKTLPEFVAHLKKLSIFNFKNCPLLEALPKNFGSLIRLRYLNLDGTQIRVLPESCASLYNLEYVNLLECELREEVTNWVKLRKCCHFEKGTPIGIGELICQQSLSYKVNKHEFVIEKLGDLKFLQALKILDLHNVHPTDAKTANFKGKQNLRELVLVWDETEEKLGNRWGPQMCQVEVLEALEPPTSLEKLKIENFMGWDVPWWMFVPFGLPNLVRLEFANCKGIKKLPPAIGQLPCLKFLYLAGLSLHSLDVTGFPSLQWLDLTNMFFLYELRYSEPPPLLVLEIDDCRSLMEIPWFPCLSTLKLQRTDQRLLSSVGRSQTSLTAIALENFGDFRFFPLSIFVNNLNLIILRIVKCNQFLGFGAEGDDNSFGPIYFGDSLRKLHFTHCPVLRLLPDFKAWPSLEKLVIFNCPQLKALKSVHHIKEIHTDLKKE